VYALMVRNADEKQRAKIDREIDQAAVRAQVASAGGHDPRRRRRDRRPVGVPPATTGGQQVIETGRYRKVAPPGFTPEEIARDAEVVKQFVAQTGGGRV
jgi:hypothetical protein